MLRLGPGGFHAVTDDGSEGTDREVLLRIESKDRRAVGGITDDGEGDNRHRVTLTQLTRLTEGGPDFEIGYTDGRTAAGEVGCHEDCPMGSP